MRTVQFQIVSPGPIVKKLLIANVAIWVVCSIIFDKLIFPQPFFTIYFGFIPELFVESFFVWQIFTYMFLHATSPMHVLFNMISLWFFGSELELRWGSRFFLIYYLVTGVGAAVIYLIGMITIGLIQGHAPLGYGSPVVGASGAIFGILLAYGILFGERMIYFFGVFPLKAKHFVLMIGAFELISLLNAGTGSSVANLAHLGGLITGALFLWGWTRFQQRRWRKGGTRRNLRLVVNKSDKDKEPGDGPKYWN